MDWEGWIQSHSTGSDPIALDGFTSSSPLVAALTRIQIARGQILTIEKPPEGLYGLARMLGVDERFIWEHNHARHD